MHSWRPGCSMSGAGSPREAKHLVDSALQASLQNARKSKGEPLNQRFDILQESASHVLCDWLELLANIGQAST